MKKTLLCLGLLAVAVALLAPTAVQAAERKEVTVHQPPPDGIPAVGMPQTNVEDNDTEMPQAFGSDTMIARGSAIVAPRGGDFMSSKRVAEREIRTLIRKLD